MFSNKKLFQSFLQKMCIKVKNQPCFSKSLLLIITDGRIRRMQMDKKVFFYHAVWRHNSEKQSVLLVSFRNRSGTMPFGLYLLLDVWCILGDKPSLNFKSMRNVSLWYCQLFSAPIYKTFFHLATGKIFIFSCLF